MIDFWGMYDNLVAKIFTEHTTLRNIIKTKNLGILHFVPISPPDFYITYGKKTTLYTRHILGHCLSIYENYTLLLDTHTIVKP